MKLYILLFSGILLFGCNCYKNEEFKAIEDITNDYLFRNNLNEILNPPPPPPPPPDCLVRVYNEAKIPNIDSLDLKVYISDALLPISQIKEDNEWMFTGNNYSIADSLLYQKILNSRMFRKLGYREFNKHKLSFRFVIAIIVNSLKFNQRYINYRLITNISSYIYIILIINASMFYLLKRIIN